MATVEYRHITKRFGPIEVLRGVSLAIAHREFVVLLGPSGCGKTTLLRMTAGLETISGGELLIADRQMNDVHPRDRDIAMVFQNYALYPTMKVFDNIAFSLQVRKLPADEIKKKVRAAAEILNISDYLDRYPKALSGGQRQRVAMGRAMVRDAAVFLFDEPLSNLDAKLRAHMRVEIRQLHNRLGTTTIYVTHDQIEAMTMADRIVLMKDGDIEQVGTPDELYDKPVSRYAAGFIGSPTMNFIAAEVVPENGLPVLCADEVRLVLPEETATVTGRQVVCGLRPSDLTLREQGGISGRVILTEKTGAEQNLHLSVGEENIVVTMSRDVKCCPGDIIGLGIPEEKIHLFDTETGQRL